MGTTGDARQSVSGGEQSPLAIETGGLARDLLLMALIASAFLVIYLVDAGRQDFTNASENVVVQAAIETHQGGPWWIPNLEGAPRILKPPFPTWIAIFGIRDATLAATRSGDLASREAAFHQLAFEARWPFCLSAALTLVVVFLLGRLLASRAVGFASAVVCGSTLLFLRFGTMANTDIQLTLWVACANLCLALVVLKDRWWLGWAGAGLALGLAMMSKGPVGLLQSLLPMGAFVIYRRFVGVERPVTSAAPSSRHGWLAVLLGVALFAAISLPWPISVVIQIPDAVHQWWTDVFNPAGTADRPRPWWGYIALVPNMVPWLPLFIAGLCLPFLSQYRRKPIILAWMLFIVPVVAMSFGKDKNERYGLPMVVGASLVSGFVAVHLMRHRENRTASDRIVVAAQVVVTIGCALAILLAALPLADVVPPIVAHCPAFVQKAIRLSDLPQTGWYSWPAAIAAAGLAAAALVTAFLLRKRVLWAWIPATATVSLILYHMVLVGFAASPIGQEYKYLALVTAIEYPQSEFWFCDPRPEPRHAPTDISIYGGRPIRTAVKLTDPPVSTRTQVMFVLQQKGAPEPVVEGWQLWKKEPVENRFCCAFVRTPR